MDKLFDSYWVLRITALILALLLFFYVKAELNNGQATTANNQVAIITDVPLEVYYDDTNLIVSGLPETVDVTIEGPTQIVWQEKLAKDYKVFVDLNTLPIGEHTITIQHENFSEKVEVSIEPKNVDITIEEKVTAELRVDPEMNSRLLAEGFELDGMVAEPGTVFITGAKSAIESISYVKANITGKPGIKASFAQEADVKVLDSNLNKLDVTIEPQKVSVQVGIYEYNRELPIRIDGTGTPKANVTINSLTSETKNVKVFGPKTFIDALTEVVVEFDVSEIEDSDVYEVDLSLPKGATKLSSKKIKIQANVSTNNAQTEEQLQPTEENKQPENNVEEGNTEVSGTEENTTNNQ